MKRSKSGSTRYIMLFSLSPWLATLMINELQCDQLPVVTLSTRSQQVRASTRVCRLGLQCPRYITPQHVLFSVMHSSLALAQRIASYSETASPVSSTPVVRSLAAHVRRPADKLEFQGIER